MVHRTAKRKNRSIVQQVDLFDLASPDDPHVTVACVAMRGSKRSLCQSNSSLFGTVWKVSFLAQPCGLNRRFVELTNLSLCPLSYGGAQPQDTGAPRLSSAKGDRDAGRFAGTRGAPTSLGQ